MTSRRNRAVGRCTVSLYVHLGTARESVRRTAASATKDRTYSQVLNHMRVVQRNVRVAPYSATALRSLRIAAAICYLTPSITWTRVQTMRASLGAILADLKSPFLPSEGN